MSNASASGCLPPESAGFDWRGWVDSDAEIMLEYHVSRWKVRVARERAGARALPRGRPRGGLAKLAGRDATVTVALAGTAAAILDRFMRESRAGGPAPTTELLATRIRAAHEARENGDQLAYEDALIAIASAAGLVHQHQRRL